MTEHVMDNGNFLDAIHEGTYVILRTNNVSNSKALALG